MEQIKGAQNTNTEKLDNEMKKVLVISYNMLDLIKDINIFFDRVKELNIACERVVHKLGDVNKLRDQIRNLIQLVNDDIIKFNKIVISINLIKLPEPLVDVMLSQGKASELNMIGSHLHHIKATLEYMIKALDNIDAFKYRFGTEEMKKEWFDKNDSIY